PERTHHARNPGGAHHRFKPRRESVRMPIEAPEIFFVPAPEKPWTKPKRLAKRTPRTARISPRPSRQRSLPFFFQGLASLPPGFLGLRLDEQRDDGGIGLARGAFHPVDARLDFRGRQG